MDCCNQHFYQLVISAVLTISFIYWLIVQPYCVVSKWSAAVVLRNSESLEDWWNSSRMNTLMYYKRIFHEAFVLRPLLSTALNDVHCTPLLSSCGLPLLSFFSLSLFRPFLLYFLAPSLFHSVFMNRLTEASSAGLGLYRPQTQEERDDRWGGGEWEFGLTWRVIAVLSSEPWTFSADGNDKVA